MKAESHRTERVGQLVRSIVSSALLHENHDPLLQQIVVTEVVMTRDLRIAKVYYTSDAIEKVLKPLLQEASRFLRKRLAEEANLRFVPELQFYRDTHTQEVQRIYELLEGTHGAKPSSNEL